MDDGERQDGHREGAVLRTDGPDDAGRRRERDVLAAVATDLRVGGRRAESSDGRRFDVLDPATEEVIASVADGTPDDGRRALDAAVAAQASWAATPPRERGEVLRRAFELLVARSEDLALLMTLEMGKPLAESRAEVTYAAEFFRWFSEEAVRVAGTWSTSPDGTRRLLTSRRPVGPCLLVTPWNFPLAMGTRKIGPALAAGCTAVLKPAAQTPLCSLALADVLAEAGLPDGVLSVVTTTRAGDVVEPLLRDPRLRKLSFTGSTAVGRTLVGQSAQNLLRTSMELGGNAPFVVLDDADVEAAVDGAMAAKMRNMGEACTSANRFVVQHGVLEEFTARLTERMAAQVCGRGTTDGVTVGPLVEERARAKVVDLVEDAVAQGASVRTGGTPLGERGFFHAPTVLADVPRGARLLREEVFGPVAPVVGVATDAEAVDVANDTEYGLVAYLFTRDVGRALRVTEALDTGMVGLNQGVVSEAAAPFGGVGHSGFGREGGRQGIEEYLETRYVGMPA